MACGARFNAALVQLAALARLPNEPAVDGWADEARERFEIVKSPALLERLDDVLGSRGRMPPAPRTSVDEAVSSA
jgi:hypothetical protein